MVDGEMEIAKTVTTPPINQMDDGQVGTIEVGVAIPCEAVASSIRLNTAGAVVDGEVQRDCAVAADGIGGYECGSVGAGSIGKTVPCVAIASGMGF